jgi:acetyl-CoA/propionyl-CoA carboxylase biotin carboxyl carrier protein
MWLGARDCSLQRRHQKLIEETPPPRHADLVPAIGAAAVRVANACGYVNAGTIEFLVDPDTNAFYFLEVNARLQVEHTVTEQVHGLDLVAAQLRIAAGEPLGFGPEDVREGGRFGPRGHAIECRINAEDPAKRFLPRPGPLIRYREPSGPWVRVDGGFGQGDEISPAYDSLIAKLVVWGADREEARRRTLRALDEFEIGGIPTTIAAHRVLLEDPAFVAGTHTTRTVERGALDGLRPPAPDGSATAAGVAAATVPAAVLVVDGDPVRLWHPAMAGAASGATVPVDRGPGDLVAPMHGTILEVLRAEGDRVEAGETVAILEAMKMETPILSPAAGTIADLVGAGAIVEAGQTIGRVG